MDPDLPLPASAAGADPERERLRRDLDATRALLDSVQASLRLQGLRGDGLQAGLDGARHRIGQLERSVSWRLTTPLRYARALAAGRLPTGHSFAEAASHLAEIVRDEGLPGLGRRARRLLPAPPRSRRRAGAGAPDGRDQDASVHPYQSRPATRPGLLSPQILIVAELSVPQCAKYRVWQKKELFERLGWSCRVVGWREIDHVTTALQLCTEVIFYRVPGEPAVLSLIAEARRVGLDPWWEVDDLIFDEALYRRNSNLLTLEPALRREVLKGVALYRVAMLACRRCIASTASLAARMREAGIEDARVVENALDRETLEVASGLRATRAPSPDDGPITIVYGSGTKTHDADFACAAPAILALMRRHRRLRLRIVGDLTLPAGFEAVAARVEEIAGTNYRAYLSLLAGADIAIAPLEDTVFNDAKSNIKFQEAAILGIPSVCSPRQGFREVVVQDHNGLLADTEADWEQALERLIQDPALRRRLGAQGLADVLERYAPDRIAREQLARIAGLPEPGPRSALRILSANIFFPPQSFGGATVVAQELASRLDRTDGRRALRVHLQVARRGPSALAAALRLGRHPGVRHQPVGFQRPGGAARQPVHGGHLRPPARRPAARRGARALDPGLRRLDPAPGRRARHSLRGHAARRLVAVRPPVHGARRRPLLLPDPDRPARLPELPAARAPPGRAHADHDVGARRCGDAAVAERVASRALPRQRPGAGAGAGEPQRHPPAGRTPHPPRSRRAGPVRLRRRRRADQGLPPDTPRVRAPRPCGLGAGPGRQHPEPRLPLGRRVRLARARAP